jgi:hypothetical protein
MAGVDSDLAQLAADLRLAPGRAHRESKRVMKRGALETKKTMQRLFTGHNYAPQVPASLEFEQVDSDGLVYDVGEIDSDGPQWGLAAILAYGTSNNAPVVDHTRAASREGLVISERLGDAGEDAVLGAGGRA